MNTEKIAEIIAQRVNSMLNAGKVSEIDDDNLLKVVIAGAVRQAITIQDDSKKYNDSIKLLSIDDDLEKCVNFSFNQIVQIVCSEEVLKLSVELVKKHRGL